jgi:hypothetical protein
MFTRRGNVEAFLLFVILLCVWLKSYDGITPNASQNVHASKTPLSARSLKPEAKQLANLSSFIANVVEPLSCLKPERVGHSGDGGWDICADDLTLSKCIVYSGGTRDDASFDISMTRRGCEVHAFDPSLSQMTKQGYSSSTTFLTKLKKLGVVFHAYGFGGTDLIYPPKTVPWAWPGIGYGKESNDVSWSLRTFESVIRDLGHSNTGISIFKVDIEGAEWSLLERMLSDRATRDALRSGNLIRQIIMEVHFLPHFDKESSAASSVRHPRSTNDVDLYNMHNSDLLLQLQELGFVIWKHSENSNVLIQDKLTGIRTACCHEISMIWRQPYIALR